MTKSFRFIAGAISVSVVLAACGGGTGDTGGSRDIGRRRK